MEKSPNETFNDYYKKIINKIQKYINQQKTQHKVLNVSILQHIHS